MPINIRTGKIKHAVPNRKTEIKKSLIGLSSLVPLESTSNLLISYSPSFCNKSLRVSKAPTFCA